MNKILFTLLCGAAILTSACSSDNNEAEPSQPDNREVAFICQYAPGSRATDTAFEDRDQIGVYMTGADATLQIAGNELNNELFSYNGSNWTSARKVYWNEGLHNVYAYYPYTKTVSDVQDFIFKLPTDQTTHEGFTSADFLWASQENVAASQAAVPLQFSHRFSKVTVKLERGENYSGEIPDNCRVYIHNTATTASIDLSTGGVSKATSSPAEMIETMKLDNTTFQAIVIPQNIEVRRPLVEVVTGDISYLMETQLSFKQGYAHTLTVTLSKNPDQTAIEIGGTIGGWD